MNQLENDGIRYHLDTMHDHELLSHVAGSELGYSPFTVFVKGQDCLKLELEE